MLEAKAIPPGFRLSQNVPRLTLALRLGLAGHSVLQGLRDPHIPDLHGLDGDAPGIGFFIQDGTVSRVSVDSAVTLATRTRWSTYRLSVSTTGIT